MIIFAASALFYTSGADIKPHPLTVIWLILIDIVIARGDSTFSQTHKVGNNGINANFVFPQICTFCHYLDLNMLVNVKLDVSW